MKNESRSTQSSAQICSSFPLLDLSFLSRGVQAWLVLPNQQRLHSTWGQAASVCFAKLSSLVYYLIMRLNLTHSWTVSGTAQREISTNSIITLALLDSTILNVFILNVFFYVYTHRFQTVKLSRAVTLCYILDVLIRLCQATINMMILLFICSSSLPNSVSHPCFMENQVRKKSLRQSLVPPTLRPRTWWVLFCLPARRVFHQLLKHQRTP